MNENFINLERNYLPLTAESWLKVLRTPVSQRPSFFFDDKRNILTIGQVVVRILGVPEDEEDYYQKIDRFLNHEQFKLRLISEEILDEADEEYKEDRRKLQTFLRVLIDKKLPTSDCFSSLTNKGFFFSFRSPLLNNQMYHALQAVIERVEKEEAGRMTKDDLLGMLTQLIHWARQILKDFANTDPKERMPGFLWYGGFQKQHAYFVQFLVEFGCDVLVCSPDGKDVLAGLCDDEELFVQRYPNLKKARPLPAGPMRRKPTVAYRAAKEIEAILSSEGTIFYKRWQLRDYTPVSLTLKTTYDELFLLLKEEAMIRPGFEAAAGIVKIPSLFAKIQGITRDRKEYWNRMHSLILTENTLFIKQFPFSRDIDNDLRFHYRNSLDSDGLLNAEKMIRSRYWKYKRLPTSLQKGIAAAIRSICARPALKPLHKESLTDLRVYLFTQLLQLPGEIITLLQNFDYSREVPKIVIFNNGLHGVLTRADACALLLLNQIGVDIVIFNPSGLNDIENYLDENLYDIHWLEDVVKEQEYKKPSFIKKLYYQGLFQMKKRRLNR